MKSVNELEKGDFLTVMKDPSNNDFYIGTYSGDEGNEAQNLAYKGSLSDAIEAALNVWGLSEDDIYIVASS